MPGYENATTRATVHANATVRLCSAREELWGAERRHTAARGTLDEAPMFQRVGEATAELATREQWLHWIEHGTTIRPAADGEWGVAPDAHGSAAPRSAAPRTGRGRRVRITAVPDRLQGPRRLRSVT
jgi:hypothetical protein